MTHTLPALAGAELDRIIDAFEAAQHAGGGADVAAFLPAAEHPQFGQILCELVRVDLEYGWRRGQPTRVYEYGRRFPQLLGDRNALKLIAFEEYRQRRERGQNPRPEEYERLFGIATQDWPRPYPEVADAGQANGNSPGTAGGPAEAVMRNEDCEYRRCRVESPAVSQTPLVMTENNGAAPATAVVGDLKVPNPAAGRPLADALLDMPAVGGTFGDFQLIAELGRGAFGRVFLARQEELADRLVALKITGAVSREPQTLAQLQHTNIVPVYSIHRAGAFQAVCMPYFGSVTLADVYKDLRGRHAVPTSGKHFVSTLHNRKSTIQTNEPVRPPSSPVIDAQAQAKTNDADGALPAVGRSTDILERLDKCSYVEAVLWIAARVADGLAHAHERGIIHRDLKPANVLLTDEGQPMLLDFNLSDDAKLRESPASAQLGGTLPYMAPEHLEALQGGKKPIDGRSDLYAPGVILFELLTGQHPSGGPSGPTHVILPQLIEQRKQPPPRLRPLNRAVSPSVEAIVRKCLEPEPARRYLSAVALREDLERQLAHRPLKYAPEPCWRERVAKWTRRHPRLTSSTSVALLAVALLAALSAIAWVRGERLARYDALHQAHEFHRDKKQLAVLFSLRTPDLDLLGEGVKRAQTWLNRYEVLESSAWEDRPAVRHLGEAERWRLRQDMGDLLVLLARAEVLRATEQRTNPSGPNSLQIAIKLNEKAQTLYGLDGSPTALLQQQAELQRLSGRPQDAAYYERVRSLTPRTPRDWYLAAAECVAKGEYQKALPLARRAADLEPDNLCAWFLTGTCYYNMAQDAKAEDAYSTCIVLDPMFPWAYFNRGLARLRLGDYQPAEEDFDRVIGLQPSLAEAYVSRALARQGSKDFRGAVADLSQALELGSNMTRIYFMRTRVHTQAGDQAAAKLDIEKGLRLTPSDEPSWVARGLARLANDPAGALADFSKALELNPRSRSALQNTAHTLSEKLGEPAKAIAVLNRVLELYPDYVPARGGRGVLYGRLGKRAEAHADAEECLRRDPGPATLYQVAGIYALTSRQHADDRFEAVRLLSAALSKGYGLDLLQRDTDLDPIREHVEFRRAVSAASYLQINSATK